MSRAKLVVIIAIELLLPLILAISLVAVLRSRSSKPSAASPIAQPLEQTQAGSEPPKGYPPQQTKPVTTATPLPAPESMGQPYPPSDQTIPAVAATPLPIPEPIAQPYPPSGQTTPAAAETPLPEIESGATELATPTSHPTFTPFPTPQRLSQ